jgi:putative glutamine amidotransferase
MAVRIAIPVPTSSDPEYNQRSLPPYVDALKAAGAEPVVVPLNEPQEHVARLLAGVQGVLLPGSRYDVDPQRYGEARAPECAEADPARTAADELLLQDAFNLRKPILAICHGAQTLNVWRNGALIQDLKTTVNHRPGRDVVEAHPVQIAQGSRLTGILAQVAPIKVQVNSSHHQAIRTPGDNLRVTAVSPGDGVIEAVELDAPNHFVVAVQWHPERTYAQSGFSRAIFSAFVEAAQDWLPPHSDAPESGTPEDGTPTSGTPENEI